MQNEIDISKLTPEQRMLLLNQLQGQQKDKGFFGNLLQRRILNPLQESLGMRESLADKLRRQQIMLAQQNMLTDANERGRNQQAIDYVRNLTLDDAKNLGLNEAQLRLACPSGTDPGCQAAGASWAVMGPSEAGSLSH